jgi:hypothetical protein
MLLLASGALFCRIIGLWWIYDLTVADGNVLFHTAWLAVILTALVFAPLIWFRVGIWINIALFLGFLLGNDVLLSDLSW